MAKAPKKVAAKKAADPSKTKRSKKNKLTIDLGNLELTDAEREKLLDAVHKTVENNLTDGRPAGQSRGVTGEAATEAAGSATISATFRNADPGVSKLTATHNGEEKTITQSDTITFNGVQANDIVRIQGKSLGKADISIDREAEPQKQTFDPGTFRFHFFILA